MADIPDKILEGCKKGDSVSQEKLYRLVAPKMYGLCLQYAGNEDDAKDIMQDGFIKVFRKIDQYSGKGPLEGWIRKVMVNTALERLRSKVNMSSIDDQPAMMKEMSEYGVLETMTAEEISFLISGLSPQYRLVFNLYAIEGYSHKEIGEKLGISEGTSKSNLSRARTILQEQLAGYKEKYRKVKG